MDKYIPGSETEISFLTQDRPDEFAQMRNVGAIQEYSGKRDKTFWERIGFGGSITARPVVHNNTVYFGACDKNFYALGLDGKEKWKFPTKGTIQSYALVNDNMVAFGSGDKNLYVLDPETGELKWRCGTEGQIGGSPVIYNSVIFFSSADGCLYALNSLNGAKEWVFRTPHPMLTPLVKEGKIYAGYVGQSLYCLNTDGQMIWRFNTNGWLSAWPAAFGDNSIYFGSSDKNLYALRTDGSIKWKYAAKNIVFSPTTKSGKIYFGCADNKVYCLDSNGKKLWEFKADDAVSNITAEGERIYFGSYDNHLYCLNKDSGKLIWKFKTKGFVSSNPVVHQDRVIFGSWDCHLYCLDLDGKLVWKFQTSSSSPSKIEAPEQTEVKKLEVVMTADIKRDEKEKYKAESVSESYDANITEYASGMSKTYISSKKKGYIGS